MSFDDAPAQAPAPFAPSPAASLPTPVGPAASPSAPAPGVLSRFTGVVLAPSELFRAIRDEEGWGDLLGYYAIFVFLPMLLASALPLVAAQYAGEGSAPVSMAALAASAVMIPANGLVFLGFLHLAVRGLGGARGAVNTAKCYVYPQALVAIGTIIFTAVNTLSGGAEGLALIGALAALAFGLWSLQVGLWGFEAVQDVGQWRALAAVLVAWVLNGLLFNVLARVLTG